MTPGCEEIPKRSLEEIAKEFYKYVLETNPKLIPGDIPNKCYRYFYEFFEYLLFFQISWVIFDMTLKVVSWVFSGRISEMDYRENSEENLNFWFCETIYLKTKGIHLRFFWKESLDDFLEEFTRNNIWNTH